MVGNESRSEIFTINAIYDSNTIDIDILYVLDAKYKYRNGFDREL